MSLDQTVATRPLPFTFICPACQAQLEFISMTEQVCPEDGTRYRKIDGIWHFLSPERQAYFEGFITDYQAVRNREGRGSSSADHYRALPFRDTQGVFSRDWQIRSRSFEALCDRVLPDLEGDQGHPLKIVDLGAGNGWLSNRLALRGHHLMAVDLLTNPEDGLGAYVHYKTAFTPVQAEYDRLPLSSGQADLIVYNASFHYSESYERTLTEALRVLNSSGRIAIMDTPTYRNAASGKKMVAERESFFLQKYGFPADRLPSEHFLTYQRLRELEGILPIRLDLIKPFYGLRWSLKPIYARIRARREAAQFLLIVGRRPPGTAVPS